MSLGIKTLTMEFLLYEERVRLDRTLHVAHMLCQGESSEEELRKAVFQYKKIQAVIKKANAMKYATKAAYVIPITDYTDSIDQTG